MISRTISAGNERNKRVSLTIWHYYNGAQQAAFDELVDEFNATEGKKQGVGMAVTKSDSAHEYAASLFLKWFTAKEQNIRFIGDSGYMPVLKESNSISAEVLKKDALQINQKAYDCLNTVITDFDTTGFYTPKCFDNACNVRKILDYNLSDQAKADKEAIDAAVAAGRDTAMVNLGYVLVKKTIHPVYQLMESVRGGVTGIHDFEQSGIQEIDELHDVVEHLTDTQKKPQEQLLEEKERYRIAVESSQDMFFTLDNTAQVLELVNSDTYDGIGDCRIYPEYIDGSLIHPSDRKRVCSEIRAAEHQLDLEFRVRADRSEEYRWVNLYGTVLQNEKGEQTRLVGCVHDIQQRKLLEREQQQKQFYDPVTEFYRLKYGLEAIRSDTRKHYGGTTASGGGGHEWPGSCRTDEGMRGWLL